MMAGHNKEGRPMRLPSWPRPSTSRPSPWKGRCRLRTMSSSFGNRIHPPTGKHGKPSRGLSSKILGERRAASMFTSRHAGLRGWFAWCISRCRSEGGLQPNRAATRLGSSRNSLRLDCRPSYDHDPSHSAIFRLEPSKKRSRPVNGKGSGSRV